jgi:hypothetical protein
VVEYSQHRTRLATGVEIDVQSGLKIGPPVVAAQVGTGSRTSNRIRRTSIRAPTA